MLRPAAERGRCDIEQGVAWCVWTVHDGPDLIAAANVRRTAERAVEVVLIGGTRFRDWLSPLDDVIGRWARDEGATVLRAFGRAGWAKVLGWKVIGKEGDMTGYERLL